ncbi:MAG: hypothetical protein Q3W96_01550, partial [Dysosmobacter sp.]|nr:hypothetical protein [Dysosmobacter sp.]
RYEILEVDVTGKTPREAVEAALPPDTARDLYRILLTGETGEAGADPEGLQEALADRFCALEVRDRTRVAEDIWARAEEDSLRGLFLRELRQKLDAAGSDEERELVTQAVRFGLAALDHRDLGSQRRHARDFDRLSRANRGKQRDSGRKNCGKSVEKTAVFGSIRLLTEAARSAIVCLISTKGFEKDAVRERPQRGAATGCKRL